MMYSAFGNDINLLEDTPRRDLKFMELAHYDGYIAEQHFVTTEDGYILTLFRIPLNKKCPSSKGTIVYMHGLYLSSDDCLVPGPGKAHCYVYSDQCYDVWSANARGTLYGRNHTKLDPDNDSKFWDFDIDEMAMHDLPAIIDYVLLKSDETQLIYVGHSQAVAILLILCSKKPEYNANIKIGFGISPTAWMGYSKFVMVQLQGLLAKTVPDSVLSREIFRRGGIIQEPVKFVCSLKQLSYPICSGAYFALFGYDKYQITKSILPVVVGHTPSGTSVKNFLRWGQIHNNGFREYDHGAIKNLLTYGTMSPPEYDLSKVTMPWLFAGSHNDYVANVTDIRILMTKLSNSSLCVLSDTTFGHLDFIFGKDIPNYVTPILLSYLDTEHDTKMIRTNAILLLCMLYSAFAFDLNLFEDTPRRDLSFIELAHYDGYTAEQHFITTDDEYILALFRIPLNKKCKTSKGTILFMHGLYLSSDDCLVPGPGKAHCYIYSDQCYDVWAANARGNFYSRNHTKLDPDKDSKFWDFDIDEMAMHDLPAIIDYVLLKSDETQLIYVGHSQAVAILLILCSKKPEYNANIKIGFGISPTAWLGNAKFVMIQLQGLLAKTVPASVLSREIFRRGGIIQEPAKFICSLKELSYPICSGAYFVLLGYNKFQITESVMPVVLGHAPSGTSVKNFLRWGQIHNNGFREYDHGAIKNLLTYGTMSPPEYDLSKVTMPWLFAGSHNDYVANVTDIRILMTKLSNSSLCVLSDTTFGHLDFIFGKDIPNYVTPILLSYLDTDQGHHFYAMSHLLEYPKWPHT
ncbi:unnamed protein product [Chrysodeixis includens]|uniref:Partial AB-hydrolase lipase domain-containing protein n=1 Tax=Chrysodeixis includens TaxID=689277 RepID=A0A9N8PX41_CHRIL|nr:unnamed protein product [Chrysodeixis includens]